MISSKEPTPFIYLGTPYTHPDLMVQDERYSIALQMTYYFLKKGYLVYCALAHNNLFNAMGYTGDWEHWQNHNHQMLIRCNKLLVLELNGWETSQGLKAEIRIAKEHHIPIEHISEKEIQSIIKTLPNPSSYDLVIDNLNRKVKHLIESRGWLKVNTPKNVVASLMVEAAELAEHFTWLTDEQSYNLSPQIKEDVKDEIADVLINILNICDVLDINLIEATYKKIEKIKERYPVNEQWLFNNKAALNKVKKGLEDAAAGRLVDMGSFASYADEKKDNE